MRNVISGFVIAISIGMLAILLAAEQRAAPAQSHGLRHQANPAPTSRPTSQPATQFPDLAGHGPGEWRSYETMHAFFVRRFVQSMGNGLERMVTADDLLRDQRLYASGNVYTIGRVNLISTHGKGVPFAYVSQWGDPSRNLVKQYEHADLASAEKAAIEKLRMGSDVVRMFEQKQPEIIGAIRMQAQCAKCHQAKEGELLGAFRYPLQRDEAASFVGSASADRILGSARRRARISVR